MTLKKYNLINFSNQFLLATILIFFSLFGLFLLQICNIDFLTCWNWTEFNFLFHSQNLQSSYFQANCLIHGHVKISALCPVIKMWTGSYCGLELLPKTMDLLAAFKSGSFTGQRVTLPSNIFKNVGICYHLCSVSCDSFFGYISSITVKVT